MTFIGIRAGSGRPHLELTAAQLSPRTLRSDATGARIALVSTTALLLAGDHVELTIDVGPGCWLDIVDTAGTVAYDAQGAVDQPSSWTATITVGTGGRLRWKGEPFVVARGAQVSRRTSVELAEDAVALLRETLVLGRTGERGGALLSRTSVSAATGPVLVEELDLRDGDRRERPGILGGHRVVDTVSLFGRRAGPSPAVPRSAAQIFQLAAEATVGRHLGRELHRSGVGDLYDGWRRQLEPALR